MFATARIGRIACDLTSRLTPLKVLVTVTVVAGIGTLLSPDQRLVTELLREGNVFLDPKTRQPYSGIAFATFDGQPSIIAQRLSLLNGAYDGPYEAFFENQKLSSKEVYEHGVKHGPYEWYFENGQLFEAGTYEEGRAHGPYRAYWENGDLYEEGTYRHGRFDGPRRWFLTGRLIEVVTYENGEMSGLYERYTESGALDLKGMLHDGQPCGTWIERERTIPYAACGARITE